MIALSNLDIKKFDANRWIVNTPEGKNVLMNEHAVGLLAILNSSSCNEEAQEKFKELYQQDITKEEFEVLIQNTFRGLNLLSNEKGAVLKKSSYLTLKVPLLNPKIAGILANPLSSLYRPLFFWLVFILAFLLNSVISWYSFQEGIPQIVNSDIIFTALLIGLSMLIHELGHIAACRQFGIKHGAIGFGFYFIFPVVYADITQVWNATKPQRIIANAGGIYAELIYSSLLIVAFIFGNNPSFLLASVSVFIKSLTELNPFIRYDGYWLLSDITNTPNLMKKSNDALKDFLSIKSLKQYSNFKSLMNNLEGEKLPLIFYGIANTALLTGYIIYVILKFHSEVIFFPASLFSLIQKTILLDASFKDIPPSFLWILGLYILVFKFVLVRIKRAFLKLRTIPKKTLS